MVTKEWAAIHRKHHAKVETADDPHSPQIHGINRVLWLGVFLYVKEAHNQETMERYGHGTPDDWMERNVYTRHSVWGVFVLFALNLVVFGVVLACSSGSRRSPGFRSGRRASSTALATTSVTAATTWPMRGHQHRAVGHPHRRRGTAQQPSRIRCFGEALVEVVRVRHRLDVHLHPGIARLATVKRLAPKPRFAHPKAAVDLETLHAVIANRYDVLSRYAKSFRRTYAEELERLRKWSPRDAEVLHSSSARCAVRLPPERKATPAEALKNSRALATLLAMRNELLALWERSSASKEHSCAISRTGAGAGSERHRPAR